MSSGERFVYFDCASGASAEMLLGGLVSAGLLAADLGDLLAPLQAAGAAFEVGVHETTKGPVHAIQVEIVPIDPPARLRLAEVREMVARAAYPPSVRNRAEAVLQRLTDAMARLAGERPSDLAVPGADALEAAAGAAGVCAALDWLEVRSVFSSPVNLGRAEPVVAALLATAPTYEEAGPPLVTPVVAAMLAEIVDEWSASPPYPGASVGYGAGVRDLPRPNVVRTFLGYGTIAGGT